MAKKAKLKKREPVRSKMRRGVTRKSLTVGKQVYNVISDNVGLVVRRPNSWVVYVRIWGGKRRGAVTPWSLRNVEPYLDDPASDV